jgi:hypothetical protein
LTELISIKELYIISSWEEIKGKVEIQELMGEITWKELLGKVDE